MKNIVGIKVAMSVALTIVGCTTRALSADLELHKSMAGDTHRTQTGNATLQESELTANRSNSKRAKIAIALGGGGCKGVANIGVLRALETAHVPIDCIIGTSSGAIIGSLYAAGTPLDEIEKMFHDGKIQKAMVPRTMQHILMLPVSKLTNVVKPRKYGGLTDGARLESFLKQRLPATFTGTKIPFYAVVTDLSNGQSAMLHTGDLAKAVHASNSLPPVFQPVEFDGKLCVDGGLQANLPADVLQQTGADTLISVLVYTPVEKEPFKKYKSVKAIMGRTSHLMLGAIDQERIPGSTILIEPKTAGLPLMTTKKDIIDQTIRAGEQAGALAIPALAKICSLNKESVSISTQR